MLVRWYKGLDLVSEWTWELRGWKVSITTPGESEGERRKALDDLTFGSWRHLNGTI